MITAGPTRAAALLLLGAAVALLAVAVVADPAGRLLAVPAAALLAGAGLRDLVLRPVLTAGPEGLSGVSGLHRWSAGWAEVTGLRVVTERRAPVLEIDLGETVVLLGRTRLGRSPHAVLDELERLRPR